VCATRVVDKVDVASMDRAVANVDAQTRAGEPLVGVGARLSGCLQDVGGTAKDVKVGWGEGR
jgi:hypothetical protein